MLSQGMFLREFILKSPLKDLSLFLLGPRQTGMSAYPFFLQPFA